MNTLLQQYAAYNIWANHKVTYHILQMDPDTWMQKTPSSFDSLFKTILHMWDAESLWWQRIRLHENLVIPSQAFDPSMKDACTGLISQSMQWEKYLLEDIDTGGLQSNLLYKNSKGEDFSQPVYEVILHLFNHSTYHRGQLTTMMRALGETHFPQTDFIVFSRKRN